MAGWAKIALLLAGWLLALPVVGQVRLEIYEPPPAPPQGGSWLRNSAVQKRDTNSNGPKENTVQFPQASSSMAVQQYLRKPSPPAGGPGGAFSTAALARLSVNRLLAQWQAQGFAGASLDSLAQPNDTLVQAWLFKGQQFLWGQLEMADSLRRLAEAAGLPTPSLAAGKPVDAALLDRWMQGLLAHLATQGRPFAQLQFEHLEINAQGLVQGKMVLLQGAAYAWDTVVVNGPLRLSNRFLSRYLGIEKGAPFSEQQYQQVASLLNNLSYAQTTQTPRLTLLSSGARLDLFLAPRRNNEVNVLIGLLPANAQTGGKLLLTGEAVLNLKNPFGQGENLGLNWTQVQPQSPRLRLFYQQPYLLGSRYGADLQFELFKKDSSFLTLQWRAGTLVQLNQRQRLQIFLQQFSSSLLTVDTLLVKANRQLPAEADVRTLLVGLGLTHNGLDNRLTPRRGWEASLQAAVGRRRLRPNATIASLREPGFNFSSLYDTVVQNSYQLRTQAMLARYFPLGRQTVLKASVHAGWVQSPAYYRNELFQIGGYRLLRGFDDESLFTRQYNVVTAEYRLLVNAESYLFAFADAALASLPEGRSFRYQRFLGTGIGLALNTGRGLLNFAYAIGNREGSAFNLRQSKIHVGFVSLL